MSNVSSSFRVQVFDLLTSPLVWQGQVPADGGMPRGQAENNSIRESEDRSEKKWGTSHSQVHLQTLPEYCRITYHACRSPELLPDRLDLTWRKDEAVAPGIRKLHREGVRDLRSVLKKAFVLFMDFVQIFDDWCNFVSYRSCLLSPLRNHHSPLPPHRR